MGQRWFVTATHLYAQREPNEFRALMFGDPQPRTQQEVDFIAHDVVEELIGTDASFGVTLGDIVFDDLSLFASQARTIAARRRAYNSPISRAHISPNASPMRFADPESWIIGNFMCDDLFEMC